MIPSLDIVLPCYNPSRGWVRRVIDSVAQLRHHIDDIHVILVNDGSSTDLAADVEELQLAMPTLHYIHQVPNGGKGKALRTGMQASTAPRVIFTDIDFPYTIESFLTVYHSLGQADVSIGIRDASYYDSIPRRRRLISKALRQVNKRLLRLPSADTQGGLKGMTSEGRAIFLKTTIDRYLIDLDFLQRVAASEAIFAEQVVQLREGVEVSDMGYSILLAEMRNFLTILLRS